MDVTHLYHDKNDKKDEKIFVIDISIVYMRIMTRVTTFLQQANNKFPPQSAAAIVAGVTALMLEARPRYGGVSREYLVDQMTFDVKFIMA